MFGSLSDKIGRKPIIMAGCIIAAAILFPIFKGLTHFANRALDAAQNNSSVTVTADPVPCSFQFNPVGTSKFTISCDIAKSFLAKNSVNYTNIAAPAGAVATVKVNDLEIASFEGTGMAKDELKARSDEFNKVLGDAIRRRLSCEGGRESGELPHGAIAAHPPVIYGLQGFPCRFRVTFRNVSFRLVTHLPTCATQSSGLPVPSYWPANCFLNRSITGSAACP